MNRYLACAPLLLVWTACSQDLSPATSLTGPSPSGASLSTSKATLSASAPAVPVNYRAHLSGDEVVPPRDTLAQGEAVLQSSPDRTNLSYRVIASNIENVTSAHIHLAPAGSVGPLVALLQFPPLPAGGGRTDGVLVTGTITAAALFGPLLNQPLSVLLDAIEAGNAYVDIPTNDGVPPGNTGHGDFVTGEIRGQLH
jgi:hypothetical protein